MENDEKLEVGVGDWIAAINEEGIRCVGVVTEHQSMYGELYPMLQVVGEGGYTDLLYLDKVKAITKININWEGAQ